MARNIHRAVFSAIVSTDKVALSGMLTEHKGCLALARSRYMRIWIRNRAASVAYLALFLIVALPGYAILIGPEASDLSLYLGMTVGTGIFMFVLWLFTSNPKLKAIEERLTSEEAFARDELDMYRDSVRMIRRRIKELS